MRIAREAGGDVESRDGDDVRRAGILERILQIFGETGIHAK